MNTVRDFIQRLEELVELDPTEQAPSFCQRLIVVPEAAQFSLEGTVIRTLPLQGIASSHSPGRPSTATQLIEWIDTQGTDADLRNNDLGVDLAAVLALATGRVVEFTNASPVRFADTGNTWFVSLGLVHDSELYGPVTKGVRHRLNEVVRGLAALPAEQAVGLAGALRARNAACGLVVADHSSAYGLLVVALETLSQAFGAKPVSWAAWGDEAKRWDKWIARQSLPIEVAESLRENLLKDRHIRLRHTFVEYAVANLAPSFWEQRYAQYCPESVQDASGLRSAGGRWEDAGPITDLVPTDPNELRTRLKMSYDARSKVFHEALRLDQALVMPVPGDAKQPLPFLALRRVLDHLLWMEIKKGTRDCADLPDVQLVHQPPGS